MKCYDFELNISAYIEGELKEVIRQSFIEHKDECDLCKEKLGDVMKLINKMPKLESLTTSSQFMENLNQQIVKINNKGPSVWERCKEFRPFGFSPAPTLGFALSLVMIISASYLLIKKDGLPNVNMNKLSDKSQREKSKLFKPSVMIPSQKVPSVANSDSTEKQDINNRYDGKIKLTGGK